MRNHCIPVDLKKHVGERYLTPRTEAYLSRFFNTCPACGKTSVYSNRADRLFHLDGSENGRCWKKFNELKMDLHASADYSRGLYAEETPPPWIGGD